MGVEYEVQLCRAILDDITVDDVAAVANYYNWSKNCVVKITRPQVGWLKRLLLQKAAPPISEAEIKAVFARVCAGTGALEEWEQGECEKLEDVILRQGAPVPGSVRATTEHSDLDTREVVLSNGMKVVYKHTRFLDDEVQFKAFAYGGLSELDSAHKEPLLRCGQELSFKRALHYPHIRAVYHAKKEPY
jgi:zinc protease